MARVRYNHNYFSIGFLSKHILGNTDFEGYNNALSECVNFIIQPTGGLFKRPGTYFVAEAHSDNPRLILFSYSSEDQYVCEFGNQYIRYFTKNGPLLDSRGSEVETKTDFSTEDVHSMTVQQDGNVLILVTPKGLFSLSRVSFNEFVLQAEEYTSEPLTFANYERISIKPSTTTGDIELTVVNPDQEDKKPDSVFAPFFNDSDVGHYVVLSYRLADTDNTFGIQMYYLKIKSVSQDTGGFNKAIAEIDKSKSYLRKDSLPSTDSVLRWHLGAFNASRGMPIASACYEGRLFLANSKDFPNGIWGSSKVYFDWTDFFPGPNDADAVMFKMTAQKAGEILWLCAQSKLFVGTRWGIYIAGAASFNDEAITPSNFHVPLFEATGASPLAPVVGCGSVFFVDVSGKRVHEIHLSTETGAYQADDISLLSDDLTQSGIVAHEWQQNPIKTYWCAVQDGYLCSLTYLKNNGIMAWAKHEIMGNNVKVEQLCTMHGDKNDLLWMVVRREIDGEFKRYIEYLHSSYDPLQQEEFKQFYVDSGVTKELKHKISDIKRGNNPKLKIQISASIASQLKELISTNNGVLEIAFNPAEGTEDLTIPNFSTGGDICFGGRYSKKFVAVQSGVQGAYSTDGEIWNNFNLPDNSDWCSICYGQRKFIAVSKSGKAAHSFDNMDTWHKSDLPFSGNHMTVCYWPSDTTGYFVAISDDSDKIAINRELFGSWRTVAIPYKYSWTDLCFGNEMLVLVAKNTNVVTFTEGDVNNIKFKSAMLPVIADWCSVCYCNGKFIAVSGGNSNEAAYGVQKDSGLSWSSSKLPSKANWTSVHAIDDTTVVAISDSQTAYSTDGGISWKSGGNLPQNNWVGIANGNRRLIAINNTNKFAYSQNGIKWHSKKKADAGPPWNSRKRFFLLEPQIDNQYLIGTLFERVQNGSEKFSIKMKTTDFTNLSQQDRCELYLSISDITGKQGQDIKCDTRMLSNGDEVILFDTNIEDFEKTGESYIIHDKTAVTVEMYDESGLGIEPNKGQIFRKISDLITVVDTPKECEIILEDEIENDAKRVYINKVNGMKQINNTSYKVFNISQDRKTITVFDERLSALCGQDAPLDAQHFSPFDTVNPTGNAYVYFDQMENLDHLEGQEVDICADGNQRQSRTVKDGTITFKHPVMYCSVGLCVSAHVKTTPFSGGSLLGSSVGAVGGQKSMWLHLYYSLGGRYGSEKTKTYPVPYTNFVSNFDKPKNLISGLIKCPIVNSKDVYDRSVYIEHNEPLAFNILSITQDINVSDS